MTDVAPIPEDRRVIEVIEKLAITPTLQAWLILVWLKIKPVTVSDEIIPVSICGTIRSIGFWVIEDGIGLDGCIFSLERSLAEALERYFLEHRKGLGSFFENNYRIGNLLGFPETAVRAYSECSFHEFKKMKMLLLNANELPSEVCRADFMAFCNFRLSRANWRAELETVKGWAGKIREFSPRIYQSVVERFRFEVVPELDSDCEDED